MDITIDDNRNVYVVSDIHNYADGFKRLLKKIQFNENDLLIIDGDIFDRGDKPVELYFEILKYPNIQVIQGNHDVWVARQIIEQFGHRKTGEYISYNTVAIMEKRLTAVDMLRLAEWIPEKPYYINLTIRFIININETQILNTIQTKIKTLLSISISRIHTFPFKYSLYFFTSS